MEKSPTSVIDDIFIEIGRKRIIKEYSVPLIPSKRSKPGTAEKKKDTTVTQQAKSLSKAGFSVQRPINPIMSLSTETETIVLLVFNIYLL